MTKRADAGEITLTAGIDEGRSAAVTARGYRAILVRTEPEMVAVDAHHLEIGAAIFLVNLGRLARRSPSPYASS